MTSTSVGTIALFVFHPYLNVDLSINVVVHMMHVLITTMSVLDLSMISF